LSTDVPAGRRALWKAAFCTAAASLTRYDGWFLATTLGGIIVVLYLRDRNPRPHQKLRWLLKVGIVLAAVPVCWLAYNAIVYRNPLEFANGPYSAKAIERKTSIPGSPAHPGTGNLPLAALYFVKSAEINLTESNLGGVWLILAGAATLALAIRYRRLATAAILWSPVAFYAFSVAYGGVPIFMPSWYPFSAYNVRYGLQLIPAFAVFLPVAVLLVTQQVSSDSPKRMIAVVTAILFAASYVFTWRAQPVCYREAWINSRTRLALESQLARQLLRLPSDASFLMYLGNHVGALQQAGIPLRNSVNEGNHRVWMQPVDPDGLWERSLAKPSAYVDYVVAVDGDPVMDAVRNQALPVVSGVSVEGQPPVTIYRAR
jgi:hypothetical protein